MEKYIFLELSYSEALGDQVSSIQGTDILSDRLVAQEVKKLKGKTRLEALTLLGQYGFRPVLNSNNQRTGATVITMMKQISR